MHKLIAINTLFLILFHFPLVCFSQVTIEKDTSVIIDSQIKYKFERLNNSRTKKLKQGHDVNIKLCSGDTSFYILGSFYEANDSVLKILPRYQRHYDTGGYSIHFEQGIAAIPVESIQTLKYTNNSNMVPLIFAEISLITGLFVAPLASIDKNSPRNFNTKKYKTIVFSSLIGVGAGVAFTFILGGGKNRFYLKPKVLN